MTGETEQDGLEATWERMRLAADATFHEVATRRAAVETGSPEARALDARLEAITAVIDLVESALHAAIRRARG